MGFRYKNGLILVFDAETYVQSHTVWPKIGIQSFKMFTLIIKAEQTGYGRSCVEFDSTGKH